MDYLDKVQQDAEDAYEAENLGWTPGEYTEQDVTDVEKDAFVTGWMRAYTHIREQLLGN